MGRLVPAHNHLKLYTHTSIFQTRLNNPFLSFTWHEMLKHFKYNRKDWHLQYIDLISHLFANKIDIVIELGICTVIQEYKKTARLSSIFQFIIAITSRLPPFYLTCYLPVCYEYVNNSILLCNIIMFIGYF
jgi:hypothetical protein